MKTLFRKPLIICTYLPLLYFGTLFADERVRPFESSRNFARGKTYIAAHDSNEAIRSNPATMAESEKLVFQLRWFDLDLFVGENTINSISGVTNISSSASAIDMLDLFAEQSGKRQYLRFQLSPFSMRLFSFEISPFFSTANFVDLRLITTTPEVLFVSDTFAGVNVAYSHNINKMLSVGFNVFSAHRTNLKGNIAFSQLLNFVDDPNLALADVFSNGEGMIVGLTLGMIFKPTNDFRLGLTIENVGDSAVQGDSVSKAPSLKQAVGIGSNYRIKVGSWLLDLSADFQDIINPNKYSYLRLFHFGAEFGKSYLSRDLDIGTQLGVNEGYLSVGAFMNLWLLRMQVSYYAVELGEYAGQRSDRRIALSLNSSMTF